MATGRIPVARLPAVLSQRVATAWNSPALAKMLSA